MTEAQIEAVATGLTEKQRDCLMKKAGDKSTFFSLVQTGLATYEPIMHGVGGAYGRIGYIADLTPLGLQVRAHLQRERVE